LTQTNAVSIYQPISGMSNYLTTSSASSTYLSISSATSIYQPISGMSNYIQNGADIKFNTSTAKLSFPSSFPTIAVNNNNAGIGYYWNQSGYIGETDLICYGQAGIGGLSIYCASNTTAPTLISEMNAAYIKFYSTLTISNNLYLDGSLFYNGLDTSTQIVGLNNITLIPISSNTLFQ
jgi:hypothetical protein